MLTKLLDRPIAFHRIFVSLTGSIPAALMLSQALYWSKRTSDADGWFWKTGDEWEDETGLSRTERDTARAALRRLGFWQEWRGGVPAKLWYRLDEDLLDDALVSLQTRLQESCKLERGNPANKSAGSPQSHYTETTSETTIIPDAPLREPSRPAKPTGGKKAAGGRQEARGAVEDPPKVEAPSARFVRLTIAEVVSTEEPQRKEFVAAARLLKQYSQEGAEAALVVLYHEWAKTHDPKFGGFSITTFAGVVGGMIAKRRASFDATNETAGIERIKTERGVSWQEAKRIFAEERSGSVPA